MKIINARTQKPQAIPFTLGEAGRGRKEVAVGLHGTHPPADPGDVGFVRFGEGVVLTAPRPGQTGILLRINTQGCYTRNSSGRVTLKAGHVERLAAGYYAAGDAGGIQHEPDELWHVPAAAVFTVHVAGGQHKGEGYGWFYLLVLPSGRVVWERRERLCQTIVADTDPEVSALLRRFVRAAEDGLRSAEASGDEAAIRAAKDALFNEGFAAAFKAADELEDLEEVVVAAVHYAQPDWQNRSLAVRVRDFGIEIPPSMKAEIPAIGGIKSGVLIPGQNSLALFQYGGGGKRYGCRLVLERGLQRLATKPEDRREPERALAMTTSPDWCVAWVNTHDGQDTEWVVLNAFGTHRYTGEPIMVEPGEWINTSQGPKMVGRVEVMVETKAWPGVTAVPMGEADLKALFGLTSNNTKTAEPARRGYGGYGPPRTEEVVVAPKVTPAIETVTFTQSGKDFRCSGCGCFTRMPGQQYAEYQKGVEVTLACVCGKSGTVKK